MSDKPIGDLIDARGVKADLCDDDLVSDIVVLMKVAGPDGTIGIIVETPEGLDWITQLGMVDAAKTIIGSGYKYSDEDE